ncbi:uncharacterized protein METZ01_LOCUS106442 [marine metagenome]|jgi:hypothetical protein|uniref:Uncharacterized protein n=1 Tax=marine metagenome TaxID=408172 RepID=A0A381WN28_9ZZZZ
MAEVPRRSKKSFKKANGQRKAEASYAEEDLNLDRELLELQGLRRCSYSECDSLTPLYAPNCAVCERVLKPLEP